MVDHEQLGDEIALLSARLNVSTHRLLTCIRKFDESDGWYHQGAMTCAHWLTWRIGLDRGAAREKVRVARALGKLPLIDAAFGAGKLSYAKVRAISRVANETNEQRILDVSLAATGAQLERICSGLRRATEGEKEAAQKRMVRGRMLGNGLVKLEVVVTADEADRLLQAIGKVRDEMTPSKADASLPTAPGGVAAPAAPRPSAADALMRMAAATLSAGAPDACVSSDDRGQVVIHVDRDLVSAEPALAPRLEDGTRVSAETLRRVACDGGVVLAAVDQNGDVLDVGRRTRAIPVAIRRALSIRDQHCRFPGCQNQSYLHGHHIQHWLHGGPTSLDNLVLLCSFHHRLLHEGGYVVALKGDGGIEVRTPQGFLLPANPVLDPDPGVADWGDPFGEWVGDRDEDDEDEVDEYTTMPSWDGERMDLAWVVGELV
jgi:uncharacterized protein DUF222/HNH endonuclease